MQSIIAVFAFSFASFGGDCFKFFRGKNGIRMARFERFNGSCAGPHVPITMSIQGMVYEAETIWTNFTVKISQDIPEEPKLLLNMEKCRNAENLNTCEHFHTYTFDKYCHIITVGMWQTIHNSFEPKFKCPLKKGIYKSTNTECNMQAFLLFPSDAWYWRIKLFLLDKPTSKIIGCVLGEVNWTYNSRTA